MSEKSNEDIDARKVRRNDIWRTGKQDILVESERRIPRSGLRANDGVPARIR